ncbi:alpha/beta fold hydrolase [Gramella sp. AN32]|uniref:YheT family hydrolase n=1 Tax=Christiangramia antarctica TaxID=2058158 RepID=A0ABW5X1J4_9FLAO|nr:alpha/beta fold hydrolase [Gramella sp. AN32]MCM4154873.1 alpha/beta hydrolase [Gramella sp. AN32]
MPVLSSDYIPPRIFRSADAATIYASKFRKVPLPVPERERLELSDGDLLDLEWNYSEKGKTKNAVILLHGLAGTASRPYMQGMAKKFISEGYDAIAMNFRGCSDEPNRKYQSYHAGATEDLQEVIKHVLKNDKYSNLILLGFSLGGNMVLKYLGEKRNRPVEIKAGIAISVPCDLEGSLGAINRMRNFIYSKRFEISLKEQLFARANQYPDEIDRKSIQSCNSLRDIDDLYTSKAHGFTDASDYYTQNSSLQFLQQIKIPDFILNAKNDSFLSEKCYSIDIAEISEKIFLEMPDYGGHVGFVTHSTTYYHEKRAFEFAMEQVEKSSKSTH